MHSKKFNDIKMYYETGRWSLTMVQNAVVKGWITEEEYFEITGIAYGLEE